MSKTAVNQVDKLNIDIFCSPSELDGDRIDYLMERIESVFPNRMFCSIIEGSGRPWLIERDARGETIMSAINDKRIITVFDERKDGYVSVTWVFIEQWMSALDSAELHVNIQLDSGQMDKGEKLLVKCSESIQAWYGEMTPPKAKSILYYQLFWGPTDNPDLTGKDPIKQFPSLGLPRFDRKSQRPRAALPRFIGWLNYWSAETCGELGFPDARIDKDLLTRSHMTRKGAWVVKLTDEPLCLKRQEHAEKIRFIYQRFDHINVRANG